MARFFLSTHVQQEQPKADQSHDQHAVRMQKLETLREVGADPFSASAGKRNLRQAKAFMKIWASIAKKKPFRSWPIVTMRVMGKATFLKIQDRDGQMQCYVTRDMSVEEYKVFKVGHRHTGLPGFCL